MKTRRIIWMALTVLLFEGCTTDVNNESPSGSTLEQRADSILQTLSLDDKVGEMTQLSIDMLMEGEPYQLVEPHHFDEEKLHRAIVEYRVGSILNCGGHTYPRTFWHETIRRIQNLAMNEKESGIPVLYGIDAIHGVNYTDSATLFPQQLGLAATFDTTLAKQMGEIVAYETRASNIPWDFSPVLDIGRDPRWPRLWETFGEDVMLTSDMGAALTKGYQGEDPSDPYHVAACMKHFLGYSMPLSGKDRTQVWIHNRQLKEYFVPSFQRAIDEGALTVMINSGEINGIPVHINKDILTGLLREEMGFEGLAVTDWEDIKYLVSRHKVAASYKEAVAMSVNAGIDMSMVPMDLEFPVLLKECVKEGLVPMERIDQSVRRILITKMKLGLFERPNTKFGDYPKFGSVEHQSVAKEAALHSITLLSNNGILPLRRTDKVLVSGPTANSLNALNGGWTHTWQGVDPKWNTPGMKTVAEAMQVLTANASVEPLPMEMNFGESEMAIFKSRAQFADVIVLCLGEMPYTEKPGDIENLELAENQQWLLREAKLMGKKVVVVLIEGRPRTFDRVAAFADAIVMAYLPGDQGGDAIAACLYGNFNPCGKLPITYPRFPSSHTSYDHKHTDLIDPQFGLNAVNPLFPFGHGLSYTEFSYSELSLSKDTVTLSQNIDIELTIENTGDRSGKETALLFIADEVASITPSVKRLRGYWSVNLSPGEQERIRFSVPVSELAFVGRDLDWVVEPGVFEVEINGLKKKFVVE